ncbi:PAS domain S-box protein [Paenibacillus sp. GSMTC-2017]|uniref:ATP-binding protein n=1 Tax=Paenibacillus sp. GSMTC-2017 TaxID=2794350 RepID=UPI0018D927D8|nr:ATP-binding protein [Paenibacillus sp. GSMTC-2017]MBH5318686.1 PAS domain S-box protein [Paenibacillus sp. GSMTC-2017]
MINSILYGNPYFLLLSLTIMCYAAFTMISMIDHVSPKKPGLSFNWLLAAATIYSLGLWTIHVVSLLTSDHLLIVDWSMVSIFALCALIIFLGLYIHYCELFSPRLREWVCTFCIVVASITLHYLSILSSAIHSSAVNLFLLSISICINIIGVYFALVLLRYKSSHYRIVSSFILGISTMGMHQFGMHAVTVEYEYILTTERFNEFMLLLAFIVCVSTLLIISYNLTTWLSVKKYAIVDERYRLLVENSMDTIALMKEGKWEYINPSGLILFEVNNEKDIIGSSIYELLDEQHHDDMKTMLQLDRAQETVRAKPIELKWKTTYGKCIYTEMVRVRTAFFGSPIDQVIIRDISERKKNEQLLINAEKLSIAGQLAAGIAHEIRNPLTSLKGFIQLLSTGRIHNNHYYSIMNSELVRIESIISELLMLSKPQVYEYVSIDLCRLMNEMIDELSSLAKLHNVTLRQKIHNQPLWVEGVETQLKQVFINVMKNAIESMEEGGTVNVVFALEENDQVKITIQDEGTGITKEQLTKMGQPFYTTKDKGTGLGLMVTYKIVENHKGRIHAESELGVGTTFIIRLPYRSPKSLKLAVLNRHA